MLATWQIAGLLALGWVASKLHTVASRKWIPMKDHDNTCREIAEKLRTDPTELEKLWDLN